VNFLAFIAVGSGTQIFLFFETIFFGLAFLQAYQLSEQGREIPERQAQILELREKRSSGTSRVENRL
jgi:hypothetical protein